MERLTQVLDLLGYRPGQARHVRSNLLSAIMLFASSQEDAELEAACESELQKVRAEPCAN